MPSSIQHLYPLVRFHRDVIRYQNSKSKVSSWLPELEIMDTDLPSIILTWSTSSDVVQRRENVRVLIQCHSPWPYCAPTIIVMEGYTQSSALSHCFVDRKLLLWEDDWSPVWNFEGVAAVLQSILQTSLPLQSSPLPIPTFWTEAEMKSEEFEMSEIK